MNRLIHVEEFSVEDLLNYEFLFHNDHQIIQNEPLNKYTTLLLQLKTEFTLEFVPAFFHIPVNTII
jgi:hypothetical protein